VPGGAIDYGASDVVFPADDATVVMHPLYGSTLGGILVVDDDTGPDGGQIAYLPLDIGRVYEPDARALIENALTYLTIREADGPSSISGQVVLVGGEDPAGIEVSAGRDRTAITDAAGHFELSGLWGGQYTLRVEREGYGAQSRTIEIDEGGEVTGVDFALIPVIDVSLSASPNQPIPDNNPEGISSSLTVDTPGTVAAVDVDIDISHYSVGHLRVTLTSPDGTTITLKQTSDSLTDDLRGNWPTSLAVDGPGSLEDLLGGSATGPWTLKVSDNAFGGTGTFNSWGINLQVSAAATSTGTQARTGTRARLVGNYPNPLNPRTSIQFELVAPGDVVLDVHDARGRLVRTLINSRMPAGAQSVVWDGTDTRGAGVASGIYYARLVTGGETYVHKMALVR
jgi:subtilisin-like proprotein convertase family protein